MGMLPAVLLRWREPVPVRLQRWRRFRRNTPSLLFHLLTLSGIAVMAGGILYAWSKGRSLESDRGVLLALGGLLILCARFAPNITCRIPFPVILNEQGITFTGLIFPKSYQWRLGLKASLGTVDCGGHEYMAVEIAYMLNGVRIKTFFGLDEKLNTEDIRKLLEDRGVQLVPDIADAYPDAAVEREE